MAADAEVRGVEPVVRARPVVAGATQVSARIGELPAAHGQGLLVGIVAEREGLFRRVLVQFVAARVFQFVVDVGPLEVRRRPARFPTLQHHHPLPGGRKLLADDGSGPAAADDGHVHRR
ncbi:hypothetical protein D3C85_1305160 [compost metagenome]